MASEALDGFDHTQYKDEVIERWGKDAYESGDRWWRSLSDAEKKAFQQEQVDIAKGYGEALTAGKSADSDEVQALTARHHAWVTNGWQGRKPNAEYFVGLGEMYVADPRFGQNYDQHAEGGAAFVRDAIRVYAERNLR